jgi:transcriptional regulator of acetoin/glycerol metabolism
MSSLTSRQDTGPAAGAGDAPERPCAGTVAVQDAGALVDTDQHADRHADRVIQRVRNGLAGLAGTAAASDDVVLQSWNRCLQQYQLHPDQPRQPAFLDRLALEERLARHADIIECARYEMTTLYQQLADAESAVVLTDTEGVIVHMVSSPEFAGEMAPLGLRVGGVWGENVAGTNGMGTCLAAGGPVSIRREDHFFSQFTQLTCSAVPVYNPAGEVAGALDVTSRSSMLQQHLLVLLGMTARMVENRLIDRLFSDAHPLHFHSRPEFVYTLHEGKLAVGGDGRILAANRSALFQLGLQSAAEIRQRHIEDFFQSSLEDMLQRSLSSSYHPVVTYRANAALRFFAVARQPASDAAAVTRPGLARPPAARAVAASPAQPARAAGAPAILRGALPPGHTFKDPRLLHHLETAGRVIGRDTPVLLCGETGCGKEVFAKAVHAASPHAQGAFVAVNCASLPETLIESELFGYRAGAFTGAQRSGRRGKVLQADGGTLFLDEIADMPLDLQARLLRVLDERMVTPLGTEETHPVDFQLISASHQQLPELVEQGRFREDLYYRLAGIELALPPLRERSDKRDVIRAMLAHESRGQGSLSTEAEQMLMDYPWPGNLRQLRHVLRSAVALADGRPVLREHLPALCTPRAAAARGEALAAMTAAAGPYGLAGASASPLVTALPSPAGTAYPSLPAQAPATAPLVPLAATQAPADPAAEPAVKLNPIQANERAVLIQLLEHHRWNVSNVAKALEISRNTLYRKLHKLHIEVSHPD